MLLNDSLWIGPGKGPEFVGRSREGRGPGGNAAARPKGQAYFARRIWHGPDDTCWHVWLETAPEHLSSTDPQSRSR